MPTLAVCSMKGGVGKSTVVLGLAGAAWRRGMSVLVVDLDPQANATAGLDVAAAAFTVNDVLADARPGVAADAVVGSGWGDGVRVVPGERAAEHRNVPEGQGSSWRLRTALGGLPGEYDLVLVDCPPSLGELVRNALAAADAAVVVTEPGYFALQGAEQAVEAVEVVRDRANLGLRLAGIVVDRVRPRSPEHVYRLAELRAAYGALVLDPVVPERAVVQQAQGAGVPVQALRSAAARHVSGLFDALLTQVLAGLARPVRAAGAGR